jgi:transcriptional regulator with XRE-family HTH domain
MKEELLILGRRIRRARMLLGYTEKDFAAKCDLDRSYLGGVERGECDVTFAALCAVCEGLTCDIAAITKGIPPLRS